MSLRRRIVFSYMLIIAIGIFYLVRKITDPSEIEPRYMESVEEPMVDVAHLLASVVELEIGDGPLDPGRFREAFRKASEREFVAQIYSKRKTSVDLHLYITNAEGIVIFDSDGGRAEGQDYSRYNDVYLTLRGKYGARSTREVEHDDTSSVLYVAAPIRRGDQIAGVLTVSKPQKSMTTFMQMTRRRITLTGIISTVVVVLVGSIFATWLTRPIQRLTDYAKAVRDGRRVALPDLGTSEVATLGRTIEDMRDALEGRKYVEHYVQTLTHEIKSPVAAIRGAAELLQEEEMPPEQRARFTQNVLTESIRIQEIVDRLLLLSAVEARKALDEREAVNLVEILRNAMHSVEAQALGKKIKLELRTEETRCIIHGDRFLLEKAVLNLLMNAVAFARENGRITCALECAGERCRITVEDDGPGIPDFAQARVFDRFYSLPRPDTGRKSSGLGLALVKEVALLHGGSITLTNREGGGATATLELMASATTASS
ncbi:MAG: two-component system sensor histidine kinase CreC [Chthoniobacteraceae bacterium]